MFRCAVTVFLALALAGVTAAHAQTARNFSVQTLRGALEVTEPPAVLLNGEPARLAPGARIFGQNNTTVVSSNLVGQRVLVHYTVDLLGQLKDIWLLTPQEAARQPWPRSRDEASSWVFNAAEQTWARP